MRFASRGRGEPRPLQGWQRVVCDRCELAVKKGATSPAAP